MWTDNFYVPHFVTCTDNVFLTGRSADWGGGGGMAAIIRLEGVREGGGRGVESSRQCNGCPVMSHLLTQQLQSSLSLPLQLSLPLKHLPHPLLQHPPCSIHHAPGWKSRGRGEEVVIRSDEGSTGFR